MNEIQEKYKLFFEHLKVKRLDLCYDISNYLVERKAYNTALHTLLIFNKIITKEPLKYLPFIHKLIAELLNKKYPFIEFFQDIGDEYIKNDLIYPECSFVSYKTKRDSADLFIEFEHLNNWQYFDKLKTQFEYCGGRITKDSWRDSKHFSRMFNGTEVFLDKILEKKLKIYSWESTIGFAGNLGKSIKECFDFEPKIIFDYHDNLNHFTLSFKFFLSLEVFKSLGGGEKYWTMFEKNLIKLGLLRRQNEAINDIKYFKSEYIKEWKEEMSAFDCWAGGDDESQIMRGLMNGNGDLFGF